MGNPVAVLTDRNNAGELGGGDGLVAVEEHGDLGAGAAGACVTLVVHHDDTVALTLSIKV